MTASEARLERVPPGGVALVDIGGTRGALVLRTDAEHAGREIELEPSGAPSRRTHVFVLERSSGAPGGAATPTYAALFPSLEAGPYLVFGPDGHACGEVVVMPGKVVTACWPF